MRYRVGILLLTVVAVACGGGGGSPISPTPPPAPPPATPGPPVTTTTITITAAGVSPREIIVPPGTRVTFINNDTRNHEMNSDPHPFHGDCPGIDVVSFISPGQTKLTGNLNEVRRCGFHDHNQPGVTSLQGTIIVQ